MAKRAGAGGAAWLLLGPGSLSRGCAEGFVWGCWAAAGPCLLACESRARLLRDAEQPLLMAGQSRSWSSLCIPHKAFQPKVSRSNCSALHKGKKKSYFIIILFAEVDACLETRTFWFQRVGTGFRRCVSGAFWSSAPAPSPGEWSQPYQDPCTQTVRIENLLRFMPFLIFFFYFF